MYEGTNCMWLYVSTLVGFPEVLKKYIFYYLFTMFVGRTSFAMPDGILQCD